jgi:acyl-CoA thioesterase-2
MNEPKRKTLLSDLLVVDQIDETRFIGHRREGDHGRIFGGEVLAQALIAASNTVAPEKQVHSAHNYFMRPGDSDLPIHYEVFADLDGRSFSNRGQMRRARRACPMSRISPGPMPTSFLKSSTRL